VDEHSLLFRGRIYKVSCDFPKEGAPNLRIRAHDASMAMGLRRRNRSWTEMSLSDLVTDIAGAYFDRPNIDVTLAEGGDPRFSGNGIRQRDTTDLDFLNALAQRYGCEMFVVPEAAGDRLYFKAQQQIMTADPEITLYHGRCDTPDRLLSFQASSDVSNVQLPRTLSGIDYDTGEPTEVITTTVEDVGSLDDAFADENMTAFRERHPDRADRLEGLISNAATGQDTLREELGSADRMAVPTFSTEEDLRVMAANQFSTSIHGMRGSGSTFGNQRIHAQANIELADLGGRFSGIWYLSEVRHRLDAEGYQTDFECQR
jgi:phage protein D